MAILSVLVSSTLNCFFSFFISSSNDFVSPEVMLNKNITQNGKLCNFNNFLSNFNNFAKPYYNNTEKRTANFCLFIFIRPGINCLENKKGWLINQVNFPCFYEKKISKFVLPFFSHFVVIFFYGSGEVEIKEIPDTSNIIQKYFF